MMGIPSQQLPQPGDIVLVQGYSYTSRAIRSAEYLVDGWHSPWNHAAVLSRYQGSTMMIVEAQPGGAVERPWHYDHHKVQWSTGILPPCPDAGEAALAYVGVPYSYLDYAAIGLHRLHVPVPGLQLYIADTGHMICSQLADQARADAGSHLFTDGRWPGFVMPSDLGRLMSVRL